MYQAAEDRYEKMDYKRCGRSGVKLPRVSLGLWQNFGLEKPIEDQEAILCRAFDLGVTHFDLANNYGFPAPGKAEENFGEILRHGLGTYRDEMIISTKAGYDMSNYSKQEAEKAVLLLKDMGVHCLIEQPRYNMFERTPEDGLFKAMWEHGVGCICYSPLAQGALTDKYLNGIPQGSRASRVGTTINDRYLSEEKLEQIRRLNEIAVSRNQSLAQMALAWVLREKAVTSVLIGASSVRQLENSVQCLDHLEFSADELKAIDEILK